MNSPRLSPEVRRREIQKLLQEKNIVEISELMKRFNSSRATISRDLTILERKGIIKKSYGSITSAKQEKFYSFETSKHIQIREKRAIAKEAFKLINNRDTLAICPGVTTLELSKTIINNEANVHIVTKYYA